MVLQPQDVLVALKLALGDGAVSMSYAALADELGISASQAHASVKRAGQARLVDPESKLARSNALAEFLLFGLKYMCPPEFGPIARGVPTAHSASPLRELLADPGEPLVWPDPEGSVRGQSIAPLHRAAPGAARRDPSLHAGLALLDAIRSGRARERQLAGKALQGLLGA